MNCMQKELEEKNEIIKNLTEQINIFNKKNSNFADQRYYVLEKKHEMLSKKYEKLLIDYDNLLEQNKKMVLDVHRNDKSLDRVKKYK